MQKGILKLITLSSVCLFALGCSKIKNQASSQLVDNNKTSLSSASSFNTQSSDSINLLGYIPGTADATDISINSTETRAYLSSETFGLSVVDITDKTLPRVLSSVTDETKIVGKSLATFNNKAVLIGHKNREGNHEDGARIQFLSLSLDTPTVMAEVRGFDHNEGYFISVVMTSSYAYIYGRGTNQIFVFDIKDISNPHLVATKTVATGDYFGTDQLAIHNNKLFYISSNGLSAFSLSQPQNPQLERTNNGITGKGISISNNLGIIIDNSVVRIVNMNSENYSQLSTVALSTSYKFITSAGSKAYTGNSNRMEVINIADPSSPSASVNYNINGTRNLHAQGENLYKVNFIGNIRHGMAYFQVLDASTNNPSVIGDKVDHIGGRQIDVEGSLSLSVGLTRAHLINASDPEKPVVLSTILPRAEGWEFFGGVLKGDYLYLSGYPSQNFGLDIYNIQNPSNPVYVGSLPGFPTLLNQKLNENSHYLVTQAFLGNSNYEMQFYNISSPTSPQLVKTMPFSFFAKVKHFDDELLVVSSNNDTYFYDISDIQNPNLFFTKEGSINGAARNNNQVYLQYRNGYDFYLDIYDISNPSSTALLQSIKNLSGQSPTFSSMDFYNNKLFMNFNSYLSIYDFSNLMSPSLIKKVTIVSQSSDMIRSQNNYYLLDDSSLVNIVSAGSAQIPVDNPPVVNITSPTDGDTVSGTVLIEATASDDNGIVSVEFYINGKRVKTDTLAPYNFSWNTTQSEL